MWVFKKRSTSTPQPLDENKIVLKQLFKLQEALVEANKEQQKTLDRMISHRFDSPLKAKPTTQPDNSPPLAFSSDILSSDVPDRVFLEMTDGVAN